MLHQGSVPIANYSFAPRAPRSPANWGPNSSRACMRPTGRSISRPYSGRSRCSCFAHSSSRLPDPATRFRRFAYATPALIAYRAIFYRSMLVQQQKSLEGAPARDRAAHGGASRLRWEKGTRYAIWALVAASAAWDWRLVVFGYLLPFA